MINKFLDFLIDFEDLIKGLLIVLCFLILSVLITKKFDTELTKEKNIIESTQQYYKFNDCKCINNIWYCWNKKED